MPSVSIVMPVYNGGAYIGGAIDSVLSQAFDDFELVVIDDGSTDDSRAVAGGFGDPRVRVLTNATNRGLAFSRNRGIRESVGRYVAMLDADDLMLPNRLLRQVEYLERHPRCGLVGGGVRVIDEAGTVNRTIMWEIPSEEIPATLLFWNCFAQSATMIRRSAIPEEAFREGYPPAEDYDLWIRIADRWETALLPEALACYRLHGGNTTISQAGNLRASVERIVTDQLGRLGIEPSENELKLHTELVLYRDRDDWRDPERLERAGAWLLELWDANSKVSRYPRVPLGRVILAVWERLGRIACSAPECWTPYARSPLWPRLRQEGALPGLASNRDYERRRLGTWSVPPCRETALRAEAWLRDVLRDTGVDAPRDLERAVADKWMEVCERNLPLGGWTRRLFDRSPLSRLPGIGIREKVRLYAATLRQDFRPGRRSRAE